MLAEDGNLPLTPPERTNWLALCDADHDNLRAALDWLIAQRQFGMGVAVWVWLSTGFGNRREHLVEGRERLEAILKMRGAPGANQGAGDRSGACRGPGKYSRRLRESSPAASRGAGHLLRAGRPKRYREAVVLCWAYKNDFQGNYAAARSWFEQSLRVCRELGDARETAGALSNLADVVNAQGDHTQARSLLEEALSILRELGDWIGVAWSLNHLGDVARDRGDLAEARRLYQEGADTFRRLGERWGMARSSTDLGYLACDQDDSATAHSLFEEALAIFLELGHKRGIAKVLEGFAYLAVHQNNPERALTLVGAASSLRQTIGAPRRRGEQAKLDATLEPAWQQSDSAAAKATWVAGWRMRLEDAIQYAVDRAPSKSAMSTQS